MNKFTILEFVRAIFDEEETAQQAAEIGQAILAARSLRMTDIASHMQGNAAAAYKRIQRFLKRNDPRQVLGRLYQPDAEFMIGDPTEIERAQAWKTEYVGTLKDGKTKGFWALVFATLYRGRAIPCGLRIGPYGPFNHFLRPSRCRIVDIPPESDTLFIQGYFHFINKIRIHMAVRDKERIDLNYLASS